MSYEALKLDRQLCFRLYKASRAMTRLYQPMLDSLQITYPQYLTMLVLWEEERIDFRELGQKLDLRTGTISPIVQKLESLGYLVKETNSGDKRKTWVSLTEKGRTMKKTALRIPETLAASIDLDMEKYIQYITLLDELGELLTIAEQNQKDKEDK